TGHPMIQGWMRFRDGAEADTLALALAVDAMPPTVFHLEKLGWAPTVELTFLLRGIPAPGWLAFRPEATFVADGWFDAIATGADITTVVFQSTFKSVKKAGKTVQTPTGFTVTMTLAAAPTLPNVIYRVAASSPDCPSLFFEYSTAVSATTAPARCAQTPPKTSVPVAATNVVKGNSIVWTVPITSIAAGKTLSSLDAQTRFISGTPGLSLTAPQYDEATSSATYTVGK